jgi:hypothetical protein
MNAGRQSFPVSVVICALLAVLFVVRHSVAPLPVEAPFDGGMPLAAALTRLAVSSPWAAAALAAAMVVWTLLVLVQITIRFAPGAHRNYLPAQLFLVVAGGVAMSGEAPASLVAAWLMALAVRGFAFSFRKGYRFSAIFHASFFLGCMPLLYAPAALFALPVAMTGVAVYRRSLREGVVCVAGLALPVAMAGFVHWAMGTEGGFIYRELWRCVTTPVYTRWLVPWAGVAVVASVTALALFGAVWGLAHRGSFRNTPYRFMRHAALALLAVAASAAAPGSSLALLPIVAVPCAALVPSAFHGKGATTATAIYCAAVAAVLLLNLPPLAERLL